MSVAAMVTLSLVASGVSVTFDPATSSRVSVAESAATLVVPTLTVENAFWFGWAPAVMPLSFVRSSAVMTPAALVVAAGMVAALPRFSFEAFLSWTLAVVAVVVAAAPFETLALILAHSSVMLFGPAYLSAAIC